MPTIIYLFGWRFFFFSNEGSEPIHIQVEKDEKKCKYWLNIETTEIKEAYAENMSPRDIRQVKRVIFEYFDQIVEEWNKWENKKNG